MYSQHDDSPCSLELVATEEDGSLTLEMAGEEAQDLPAWLESELDAVGNLGEVLGFPCYTPNMWNPLEVYLLENGIAPGQTFQVDLLYSCYQVDYDWDSEVEIQVVGKEPLTPTEAAQRWQDLINRKVEG